MGLIINHNISALNTQRNLNNSNNMMAKSLERLSSGYKINVASDDPSGLIISEQLRSQASGLERAVRNSQEASNVISIAEGALIEMNDILKKLKALALHAANNGITAPDQVRADQAEVDSSIQTIDRIANTTRYSDQFLLNGSKGLVFDRETSVDDTMDHALLDIDSTRIDQVFKREDVSMTVSFNGVLDANNADYEKEARRAYFEADDANIDAEINGNKLSADQSFILTGTQGSRLFNFSASTTLGSMVSSINNVSASTGVGATLVFGSAVTPDLTTTNGANIAVVAENQRVATTAQIYDADLNTTTPKANAVEVGNAAEFRVGQNLDGHGRLYAKVINSATNEIEWYKDSDLTMKVGTQSAAGAANFTAVNGSGITSGLSLTLTGNAQNGDVYTVGMVGQVMDGAIDATMEGLNNWTNLDEATSVISGVELGRNTSEDGVLYFKATGDANSRKIEVFRNAEMREEDLVGVGTADLGGDGTNDLRQIRIEGVALEDGTNSNLNMTLSYSGAAGSGTETGSVAFNKLGIRLYSQDYGSQEYVRVQNQKGKLWSYYRNEDDVAQTFLDEGQTVQEYGQDATIVMNGSPLTTQGLTASITTQDFAGALKFNEGKLGETTIGQVGYDIGSLYSRATALQAVDEGAGTLANTYSYATNARHTTTETLSNFIGGMQYQLGGGEGDQERTVYGIPSMSTINIGRVEVDGEVYNLNDILAGGSASLANDPVLALSVISQAVNDVSELRARLGAFQKNMLQTNINSLNVTVENITMTESAIRDADMAAETTDFTKNQILVQAGTAMLAQANTTSQNILQLLG